MTVTAIYVVLAVVGCFACLIGLLLSKTKSNAKFKELMQQQEAENELRKKMAEVDASADVDDPLDGL